MRRAVAGLIAACAALSPCAASARASASVDGTLLFFADTLAIVGRDGATLRLADGTHGRADAVYVDLKTHRIVLAGHAHVERGAAAAGADAIALELDGDRVDLLDATAGVSRTTRALGAATAAEYDAARFAFPDVDDRNAFIKSKHATIAPHADVRFAPASFPTSVGAFPVPSYMYTYATGAGFGASSLAGATFDQPYGLFGSPTALTALHARWEDGPGAALALQQQIVSGDDAYVTASIDAPFRGYAVRSFNAYRRMGRRFTAYADGSGTIYGSAARVGLTAAFGLAGGTLEYRRNSAGGSGFDATLRTPDRPLIGGATWQLRGGVGFDAQRGGLLRALPDAPHYSTVWRRQLGVSVSSPLVRIPLGATLASTVGATRTWYSFPHHFDGLDVSALASRPLLRNVTLFAGYAGSWSSDVYPTAQGIFYPAPTTPLLTPDGTPYVGYAAFTGARTFRSQNVDLQYTPNRASGTSFRLSVVHTADFPQFNGFGRPQWEARADAKFRPFPNVGIDVGRVYDFAWGGTRWQPRWSFAITP